MHFSHHLPSPRSNAGMITALRGISVAKFLMMLVIFDVFANNVALSTYQPQLFERSSR
jgi:hypothetical protein